MYIGLEDVNFEISKDQNIYDSDLLHGRKLRKYSYWSPERFTILIYMYLSDLPLIFPPPS